MRQNIRRIVWALAALCILLTSCALPAAAAAGEQNRTLVTVTGGRMDGTESGGVNQYLGVPYARADEMFTPANPVQPWDGVYHAKKYGNISLQSGMFNSTPTKPASNESNNCQNLNIWTPGTDRRRRPVMVWLHGGGFSTGSGNEAGYNGANLAKNQDVVVVTVNHRLGVYGFLNLAKYGGKYKQSANVGMLDIVDALNWIRANIAAFGGDPDNVTLFGQSGGGAKVLALMGSPYAKGLFRRGIMESGATDTMGAEFTTEEVSQALSDSLLRRLGIRSSNLDQLQKVPYARMQKAATDAKTEIAKKYRIPDTFHETYAYEWEPVIDGDFLPENPVREHGFTDIAKHYELLIGSNLNEWNLYVKSLHHEETAELKAAYAKAYPNEDPNGAGDVDMLLRMPILRITAHKADQFQEGGAPVFSYIFTKQTGTNGVYHGAEIPYLFGTAEGDPALTREMQSLWASFARTGYPHARGVPLWEPYTRQNGAVMILDDTTYLTHHHDEPLIQMLAPNYSW
ncbi:MAG: carboxylesterase/lipase family protein [Acutalibacteraceae bacterium]